MKGDFTRFTFRKDKHYSAVRMQQGRVQMDADWNEHVDIQAYLNRTGTTDVIGKSGVPYEGGGFQIGVSASGDELTISPGRIYVDGILCENGVQEEADLGSPPTSPSSQPVATYNCQPYYPNPEYPLSFGSPPSVVSPPIAGDYLAYLDVWERHITALDDKEIREVALGGPDTATRTQIIWQVKLEEVYGSPSLQCSDYADWQPDADKVKGAMAAKDDESESDANPCSVPAAGGYRRLENQLYRVEIHESGGTPTFKWSRENGSVVARLLSSNNNKLTVSHPRKDELSRFATGDWVEVLDESTILHEKPGLFIKIGEVNGDELEIADTYPKPYESSQLPESGFIRKWEGGKPIAIDYAEQAIESGIKVQFKSGLFSTGDYWTIPARTISHSIEWPKDESSGGPLYKEREGIIHHYCVLALVQFDGSKWNVLSDCRSIFPPLTSMLRFFYLGGDGQEVTPDLSNPSAPVALDQPLRVGVSNGALPLSGQTVHFSIEQGSGQLERSNNTSPGDFTRVAPGEVLVKTDPAGVAECKWLIHPTDPHQVVAAKLLDSVHGIDHQTIKFHANPSIASEVAYKTPDCTGDTVPTVKSLLESKLGGNWPDMDGDGKATVKDILDVLLCKLEGSVIPVNVQNCGDNNNPTVRSRLGVTAGKHTIYEILDKLLCNLNATHLPVDKQDPNLCKDLNNVNVKTVQDALNVLCKMDRGRSCSIVVTPDDRLEEVLKKLLKPPGEGEERSDICICLLPGTHKISGLALDGKKKVKIRISGCGPNTLVIIDGTLKLSGFHSIEMKDLAIESQKKLPSLLIFDECKDISLRSCRLTCSIDIKDGFLLGIGGSNSINLEDNLIDAKQVSSTAVAIMDVNNKTVFDNNNIIGNVSLYGRPGGAKLTCRDVVTLGPYIQKGAINFSDLSGTLQFRNNSLNRILLGAQIIGLIQELIDKKEGEIKGVFFKIGDISENAFHGGENQFAVQHLNMTSNGFYLKANKGDAGWSIAQTAIFVGNRAENEKSILFNGSARCEKAANLINIDGCA